MNISFHNNPILIDKKLDFSWATDSINRWYETNIFHNAGVVGQSETHFSKVMYQKSPFNQDIKVNNNNCSYKYLQEIKDTEKNFTELLF
jgi:hypothetical protein